MAEPPRPRFRTRRTLVTLAGAVVTALVLWRLRPSEPPPLVEPATEPEPKPEPRPKR